MTPLAIPRNKNILTLLLAFLALAGNSLVLPLFHTVDIIFGSIFVLIAAVILGPYRAMFIALIGSSYTWIIWDHPYGMIIFITEAYMVTRFYRKTANIVLADLAFWVSIGIPMTFATTIPVLQMSWDTALLICMKQPLNGLFNAMIAGLLLLTWQRFSRTEGYIPDQTSNWYFHVILLMVLLGGAFPIIQQGYESQKAEELNLAKGLLRQARDLEFNLSNSDVTALDLAQIFDDIPVDEQTSIAILDSEGNILAQRGDIITLNQPAHTFSTINDHLMHWAPVNLIDPIQKWHQGRYQLSISVGELPSRKRILFEISSEPFIAYVRAKSILMFAFLTILTVVAIFLTYYLTRPLRRIMQVASEATDGVIITDVKGNIEWINRALTKITGYTLAEMKGLKPGKLLQGPDTDPEVVQRISEGLRNKQHFKEVILNYTKSGDPHYVEIICNPLRSDNGNLSGFMALQRDVTHQIQLEKLEAFSSHILETIAKKASTDQILTLIVQGVETLKPDAIASIVLLDQKRKCIDETYSTKLPDFYNEALKGLEIGPNVGSCGAAAATGKRVIVEDIQTHPNWAPYKHLAKQAGLASCWSQPFTNSQGRIDGTFAIYHDHIKAPTDNDIAIIEKASKLVSITMEKHDADNRLMQAANVFEHASEGILITDIDGEIIDVNKAFTQITGYSKEDVVGKNPRILSSGKYEQETYEDIFSTLENIGQWKGEIWNKDKKGNLFAVLESISTVYDDSGKPRNYIALFNDITNIKSHQEQLENLANYDSLTQLPNRTLLTDRMQQAMALAKREGHLLVVIFIDLDGFKPVNDRYGHDVGDRLLIAFSKRVSLLLRSTDTLGRLAGDEFVTLLPNVQQFENCEPLLERILSAVEKPFIIDEHQLKISASMGVTVYPQAEDLDADQLLRQSDQAMYLAKQDGKNRYHLFDATQHQLMRDHHENLVRIQEAIKNKEFILHYQPKVNLRSGEVIGVEALIRWQHRDKGLLPPGSFLPLLDNHPAMIQFGKWVMHEALNQISVWQKQNLNLNVSINIDPMHLQSPDFISDLESALHNFPDVNPSFLELEIVETAAIEDINVVSDTINRCHDLGVHFSLDDFGTGYSSLTYLKRLPIHVLKIDQSFVRDILSDPDDLAIVQGVLGLAKSFNRTAIAEGVETQKHGELLLQLGCELAQGYGISRPIEAKAIPDWIKHWAKENPSQSSLNINSIKQGSYDS
ncbi:EAL domain-containing protein [Bermanella marisrubri]|uniref:Sensory box/GGDEF/GAF/EAL domain protein n=1 Tax=Bermanella marisrubri TaxID=207949 RepID=Q1N484_9GAMM|nr:EAL domain-containing protein [Bermanella marisrubri]EAT12981.1 sensory box/GGDEF/GAF/EAL domain protein [Oceanobacter sp. RED65] [Bermanella marisrubri]QIZ82891.1 EAL domain-containing protein [Bermanella marisrubri]